VNSRRTNSYIADAGFSMSHGLFCGYYFIQFG
jgi:hypothetical protein